jgi:hypothetical protein
MKNIQKQIDKAQKIVTGQAVATKAKFLTLKAKTKQLNQTLIDKAYALAGIKGYVTNLDIPNQCHGALKTGHLRAVQKRPL